MTTLQHAQAMLNTIYKHADTGTEKSENKALRMILDFFYKQYDKDNIELCNTILDTINVDRLSSVLLVTFLTISAWQKNRLPARQPFYERARVRILKIHGPERTERILVGLE